MLGNALFGSIENRIFKRIKKELTELRKEFEKELEPIETDLEEYSLVAFHKFTFLLQKTLKDTLRVEQMMTINELVEEIEKINTNNYQLSKEIKSKEDELLNITDKSKFRDLKKELEDLMYHKDYYSTIEKNVIKNNLLLVLKEYAENLNYVEFSGEKVKEKEVRKAILVGMKYMRSLLDTSNIKVEEKSSIMQSGGFLGGLLGKKPAPVAAEESEEQPQDVDLEIDEPGVDEAELEREELDTPDADEDAEEIAAPDENELSLPEDLDEEVDLDDEDMSDMVKEEEKPEKKKVEEEKPKLTPEEVMQQVTGSTAGSEKIAPEPSKPEEPVEVKPETSPEKIMNQMAEQQVQNVSTTEYHESRTIEVNNEGVGYQEVQMQPKDSYAPTRTLTPNQRKEIIKILHRILPDDDINKVIRFLDYSFERFSIFSIRRKLLDNHWPDKYVDKLLAVMLNVDPEDLDVTKEFERRITHTITKAEVARSKTKVKKKKTPRNWPNAKKKVVKRKVATKKKTVKKKKVAKKKATAKKKTVKRKVVTKKKAAVKGTRSGPKKSKTSVKKVVKKKTVKRKVATKKKKVVKKKTVKRKVATKKKKVVKKKKTTKKKTKRRR